ncbi:MULTISPECIES: 2-hydroxyacid dehydrogenase [Cellulophaga]|jgi:D-3-phosphoglycerate dehydrogenase|uniref:D-3-phosphoglycerate dehydrogenase n=2 Tax=Cellulophaga baltica TaxID=76594 RepID=A0A1G7D9C5_9FLAO|nr:MULTISPECIES: 2-hydroxyacid dehydrogenase [Cellulophaga]AIZ41309.1 2-hydroxyacid dehydrogenase [Cellulophaga baltica 18]KGK32057.1 2-hydroxyacid dehydrogenase [Cellulophaga sp. E6(2014)]MCR1023507.1 2-hydroxyacid dehydrogenase [Cellulophaga baltica]SDE48113.1 D-3-phosphoglycerate dehydrogenase [Cellulophaga baltica]
MRVLHLDVNHPLIIEQFNELGFINEEDYTSSKEEVEAKIHLYDGIIIRSRFSLDHTFLEKATQLKFIGRLGAGLENIDTAYAKDKNIFLAAAPEGNRNAVGEHTLGMLLSLFNHLNKADQEVRHGKWDREGNRGIELDGKTVGIIGYGNMGKAFAKKLRGFDVEVLCYDIKGGVDDDNARQVGIMEIKQKCDIISLHVPQTPSTINMINKEFIDGFSKDIWILNTARGKCIVTQDLVEALKSGKVLGAGLDVLEYEKASFENMFSENELPEAFSYLIKAQNVILSPHVGGWTVESKIKLAQTVVDKVKAKFSA